MSDLIEYSTIQPAWANGAFCILASYDCHHWIFRYGYENINDANRVVSNLTGADKSEIEIDTSLRVNFYRYPYEMIKENGVHGNYKFTICDMTPSVRNPNMKTAYIFKSHL